MPFGKKRASAPEGRYGPHKAKRRRGTLEFSPHMFEAY